jgi:hypothetical protein
VKRVAEGEGMMQRRFRPQRQLSGAGDERRVPLRLR